MLLCSHPDTIHGFLLRKTRTSAPLEGGGSTRNTPSDIGITPAVADCRLQGPANAPVARIKLVYMKLIGLSNDIGMVYTFEGKAILINLNLLPVIQDHL